MFLRNKKNIFFGLCFAFLANLFAANIDASALKLGELEPIYDSQSSIELNTPEEGYVFDATFLDKNQSLEYRTTVTNDENRPLEITNITINESEYNFLEYTYEGLSAGDILAPNESKDLSIFAKTNDNTTQTVDEDYNLNIEYLVSNPDPGPKPDPTPTPEPTPDPTPTPDPEPTPETPEEPNNENQNPNTNTGAIIKTGTIAAISIGAFVFVLTKNKRIRILAATLAFSSLGFYTLSSISANAEGEKNLQILGKVHFVNTYTVTVNPNGGTYNNTSENTIATLREGEIYHVGDVTREHFGFDKWEVNPGQLNENNDIEIHADTLIKAKWNENSYTLTIKPNGGEYKGSSDDYVESFRPHEIATIETPSKANHDFTGWTNEQTGASFTGDTIEMLDNVTLVANYKLSDPVVTIDPNGGSYNGHTSSYTETHPFNDVVTMGDATREHYTFDGWDMSVGSLDENKKFTVTENVTLTAKWTPINRTLTINPNGGFYDGQSSVITDTRLEGSVIDISTPTRDTYSFDGWTVTGDPIQDDKITLNQDTTITANWKEIKFTLVIDPNGGDYNGHTEPFSNIYRMNEVADLLKPTKTGCNFAHWILQDNSEENPDPDTDYDQDSIKMIKNYTLVAQYDDQEFDVKINPNGGKFNGSTEIFTDRVKYGTTINLTNTEYADHEIRDWTKQTTSGTETLASDISEITITEDTELTINWWSSIFYTITINPNEGSYHDSSEVQEFSARKGEPFTVDEATRERYALQNWTNSDGSILNENPFIVEKDETLTANWFLAVARIERTGQLYPSIMAAHADANPGDIRHDIITLLVDTEEIVTNEKQVTLDLNNHTVTGYLTNTENADLTLINGEINNCNAANGGSQLCTATIRDEANPNGAAVINNGKLTMGVNDYTSDGTVNISSDNIRLIGTDIGLLQNSEFYFYDGFIEGIVGLDGGYDGSPFYRNTFDDTVIYYFPLVTHNDIKDCQHVALENADRAVTKTTEHGDIYYYNLQDNINTSTKTGYTIYAIRDFDASYPITVAENAEIDFDLVGYVVSAGDDWAINGTLNITDSKADQGTGNLRASRTIVNNGDLNFTNAKASTLSANTLIDNRKNMTLVNSVLSSEYGYTLEVNTEKTTLTMDDNSYLRSDTNNITVIRNNSADFTVDGGNIVAKTTAIKNEKDATLTVKSGNISTHQSDKNSPELSTIINYGHLVINGGNITASATDQANSVTNAIINTSGQSLTITNGSIASMSEKSNANGIRHDYGQSTKDLISGGEIITTAHGLACAYAARGTNQITGGTITATSSTSSATGIGNYSGTLTITGGDITAIKTGGSSISRGIANDATLHIYGDATITAHSETGVASGIHVVDNEGTHITAGEIYGDTYGIQGDAASYPINLGDDDFNDQNTSILKQVPVIEGGQYAVYNGNVSFYDGYLKGGIAAQLDGSVKQIPHDAEQIYETIDGKECSWLAHNENYLSVDGVEFNSFIAAYEAAKNSPNTPKTITVIADHTTAALLPVIESDQDITLDLNNHSLQFTQTLQNNGKLTITDTSTEGQGSIKNINTTPTKTLLNYGVLTQNGGIIKSTSAAIQSIHNYSTYRDDTKVILNAGKILVEDDESSSSLYAITCNTSQVKLNLGHQILIEQTKGSIYGISGCTTEMNGGIVTVNSTAASITRTVTDGTLTINSGAINVTSTATTGSNPVYGTFQTALTMNGGSITVDSQNLKAVGADFTGSTKINMNGGSISAHSVNKDAIGVYTAHISKIGTLNMTGGTITAHSDNSTATGADLGHANITGGTISGDNYGINGNTNSNIITLGEDDGTINNGPNASPMITGGDYGIYNGYVNFYDGVLKGATPYSTETIKAIPDGAIFHNETIDEVPNCWLEYGEPYLRVNEQEYTSLSDAYDNAASGDTIEVIADYVTQADLPVNPAGKTITIDLAGKHLSYYQTLENNGSMTIIDSIGGGILENVNPAQTYTVTNDANSTLTIDGGTISSSQGTIDNNGTLLIKNGTVTINQKSGTGSKSAIRNTSGQLTVSPSGDTYPTITAKSTVGLVYAISGGTVTINNGNISSESNSGTYTIYSATVTVNNGDISATAKASSAAYAIYTQGVKAYINGGNITASSEKGSSFGVSVSSSTATITGGNITATSTNGTAYGAHANTGSSNPGTVNVSGGTINATSTNSTAYAINTAKGTITGGKAHGSTYGILAGNISNIITIGDNTDDTLSTTSPEIIGDTYAVYSGSIYFYDGILKGQLGTDSGAYFDRNIKQIADNTSIHIDTEIIDGTEYEVKYLETAHGVARINSTEYTSLYDAVGAAQAGDTIYLIEDNYVFHNIVVNDTKDITIDLDGHTIITGNPITNNGKLVIKDSRPSTASVINYHEPNYLITNTVAKNSSVTPELTLEDLEIHAKDLISNGSNTKLTINRSKLYSDYDNGSTYAINGEGEVSITDSTISNLHQHAINLSRGTFSLKNSTISRPNDNTNTLVHLSSENYTIDNSTIDSEYLSALQIDGTSSEGEIKNHSTIKGRLTNSGKLQILDSTITQVSRYAVMLIDNNNTGADLTIKDSTIHRTQSNSGTSCGNDDVNKVGNRSLLKNNGTLTVDNVNFSNSFDGNNTCSNNYIGNSGTANINKLTITNDDSTANTSNRTSYGIVNTGTMTLDNANITLTRATSYGIYTYGGTLDMDNTTIDVRGKTTYGLYVENGDLTMGVPEPVDSPNYGTGNADVSTTTPSITAIGTTTGIGVYKNLGRFKYYDGIITGSTSAIPRDKISSDVEHLYEPTFHTDENGYDVCILTWMREQPSQPTDGGQ